MHLRPDLRHYAVRGIEFENFTSCRKCGAHLVVLPDDKRHGYCFDCTDLLDAPNKVEIESGRLFSPNCKPEFYK